MYFRVVDTNFSSDDIDEVIQHCISDEYHDMDDDYFEEWVDDNYDGVSIAGYHYSAYEILDKFDNLDAVESEYCEYATENDRENARYELRHADPGEVIYIQAYSVICEDEEEPEEEEEFYGGDDRSLETLREMVACEQLTLETERRLDEENRNDYLNLFQTIGE